MKTLKFIFTAAIAVMFGLSSCAQSPASAQSSKTETFSVQGSCGMCKSRIEKAAKLDGVSRAEWNRETKVLTVVFDPAKTSVDAIQQKIAAVGHDTEKYKASDDVYNALPGCCKYRE
jgi:copper chaperone CopZ